MQLPRPACLTCMRIVTGYPASLAASSSAPGVSWLARKLSAEPYMVENPGEASMVEWMGEERAVVGQELLRRAQCEHAQIDGEHRMSIVRFEQWGLCSKQKSQIASG